MADQINNEDQVPDFVTAFFNFFNQPDRPLAELHAQRFSEVPDGTESGFGDDIDLAMG